MKKQTKSKNNEKFMILKSSTITKESGKKITNKIIQGDTLETLKNLPSNYVNLIVTSPSYMLGKEYDKEKSFEKYLEYHSDVIEQ